MTASAIRTAAPNRLRLLFVYTQAKRAQLEPLLSAVREGGAECTAVPRDRFLDGFASRASPLPRRAGRLGALMDSIRPDVLLLDAPSDLWRQASARGVPFAVFFWDYAADSRLELQEKRGAIGSARARLAAPRRRKMVRECVEAASAVLAENGIMASAIRESYPSCRVETVQYSSIDTRYWRPGGARAQRGPAVGFVQDARRWRKVDELASVMPAVMDALPGVRFRWAGDGRFAARALDSLGRCANFEWLGRLGYPGPLREFLGSLDVYGLACSMDMSPYSLKAAQSMELPVVATSAGGIPDLVSDGASGLLVRRGDSEGWIRAISGLLRDPARARALGKRARESAVSQSDSRAVAARLLGLLEGLP